MDQWSEDSSDEYVRAEQEAALYSVVHYTEIEADANACNNASNQPHTFSAPAFNPTKYGSTTAGSHLTTSLITNQSLQIPKNSMYADNPSSFTHVPECLNILMRGKCTQSMTQNITKNEMEKYPPKLSNSEHISNQLSNVTGFVDLQNQIIANNFNSTDSSQKLNSEKTTITFDATGAQILVRKNKPSSNATGCKKANSAQTSLNTDLDSNCTFIHTFSFDSNKLDLPKSVGNNLFSPFNAQYLETKTSSEKVFRLDERLFSHEKVIGQDTCPNKLKLAQEGTESISLPFIANVCQTEVKTEAQKAFVFDLSYHSSGRKEFSPDLKLGTVKPQEPTSAISMNVIDLKSKPARITKITKKMKIKKKLKILQSSVLYNSIVNLKNPADKVVVIGLKSPETKCEVIVLDKEGEINSVDPDVIVLDSDSDESVHVVPVPSAPLPVIISVEDSSDDDRAVRLRPTVVVPFETDPDVAENSFDFLDNVIENCMGDFDGIRKAQANVLSNLISNHSSKESLVDERLFQVDSVQDQDISKTNKLPYHEDNISSSTSSASPFLESDQSIQTIGNVGSGSDTGEPKTLSHSFKVPKSKVRTKSRQTKNIVNLPAIINNTLSSSDNDKNDDDLLVVHSGTKSTTTIEEILSGEMSIRHPDHEIVVTESISSDRKRKREHKIEDILKKRKRPGRKKRAKTERMLQKLIRSHPQANLISYTKIAGDELVSKEKTPSRSPPTWTKEMKRFYNSSWGGEDHDWKKIRASMSAGHPYLWQVSNDDRYPGMSNHTKPVRCRQCQRTGHFAWACPDIKSGTKCRMCGQSGHAVKNCPNSICLKCGQQSREFLKCCWQCKGSTFGDCVMCIWQHSPAQPCKNYRAHPGSVRPHASANAGYKGYRQRYGSNQPSERGFNPYYNKNFSRRPFR